MSRRLELASHGFIAIADGKPQHTAIDWVIAQINNSDLFYSPSAGISSERSSR